MCLGRFHRRGNPKTSYAPFHALPPSKQQRVMVLMSLLRVADGLDRSHSQPVQGLSVLHSKDGLVLRLTASGDTDLELWGLRRKRELFERVFDTHLEIVVDDDHCR
jgi:exopolyphosphatase/guanosine-5'-triphosphate,3'-diphosphate pyrophosphatase